MSKTKPLLPNPASCCGCLFMKGGCRCVGHTAANHLITHNRLQVLPGGRLGNKNLSIHAHSRLAGA